MSLLLALRPAQANDLEFLYRVYAGTREEELARVAWTAAQRDAFLRAQFDTQEQAYHARYPTADFLIVDLAERPVGRLYVAHNESEIHIVDIAVLPEHRNRGIGSALLRMLAAEADVAGKSLRIAVEQFNPARRLYERLGFSIVDRQGIHYLMERRCVPPGSP